MPFGAFKPLTHSAAITFPSRPTFATDPFPSFAHGSVPSIFAAYKILLSPSNKTDSGTFKTESVSHNFSNLCCANNKEELKRIAVSIAVLDKPFFILINFSFAKLRTEWLIQTWRG